MGISCVYIVYSVCIKYKKEKPIHIRSISFIFATTVMALHPDQLHFVLFPLMAQGHMIPMIDIARLLAQHGMIVTIVTTPLNAARFTTTLSRAISSGLQIQVSELQFSSENTGLPKGCENFDMLPSLEMAMNMFNATSLLQQPAEKLFEELIPRPNCIISDMCLPWTSNIAHKYNIPRISFNGFCCFYILCVHNVLASKVLESTTTETEYFVVPGLPDNIELTKKQLLGHLPPNLEEFSSRVLEAERDNAYGLIINTFEELESAYVEEYKKISGNKAWCVGPVSLCNKDSMDKAERGSKAAVDEHECLKWLDSWHLGSVIYVCLGSLCNLITPQLIELGLALEAMNRPFIWVIRKGDKSKEIERWTTESGFEERTKARGFIIRGWAPQVIILSHPAVGGFLTHCGWNSTLEAICAGVPMVTWPLFADQFCNEKLAAQVLKIGVRVGVEIPEKFGEEEQLGVLVKKEDVMRAVDRLMEHGEERNEMRRRAKELAEMAKTATEKAGSSYRNMELLIQDIRQQAHCEEPN